MPQLVADPGPEYHALAARVALAQDHPADALEHIARAPETERATLLRSAQASEAELTFDLDLGGNVGVVQVAPQSTFVLDKLTTASVDSASDTNATAGGSMSNGGSTKYRNTL